MLQIVREAIEHCDPPGSVRLGEYMTPEPWLEGETPVRGIYATVYGKRMTDRDLARRACESRPVIFVPMVQS